MKILVKIGIFILTLLIFLYNGAIFISVISLLSKIKVGDMSWWPREVFFISPYSFPLILILSYAGSILAFSALIHFKDENKAALKNAFKYSLALLFGFFSIVLLISEIGRIKGNFGNIWDGEGGLEFIGDWELRKTSLILFVVAIVGYIWVYYQERSLVGIVSQKRKRLNLFLLGSIFICFIIVGILTAIGYFQSRIVNPGVGKVRKAANVTIYGLKDNDNYRWIRPMKYDNEKKEVDGLMVARSNAFLPVEIIQKKNSIQNEEEIVKYARENSFEIKEYRFNRALFRGYEESAEEGRYRRGKFIWHTDSGTDIVVSGIALNSYEWEYMAKEIANNFIGQ